MQGHIEGLLGRCTVLLCTHDLSEARRLASRVGVLSHGRLVACGETSEVLDREDALALFETQTASEASA